MKYLFATAWSIAALFALHPPVQGQGLARSRPANGTSPTVSIWNTELVPAGGVALLEKYYATGVLEQDEDLNGDGDLEDLVLHLVGVRDRTSWNLGIAGGVLTGSGSRFLYSVRESWRETDLNGDGDTLDRVVHVYDVPTRTTINLGIDTPLILNMHEGTYVIRVWESRQGADLNGDGDQEDVVLFVYDSLDGSLTNLGLALRHIDSLVFSGRFLLFPVSEAGEGVDLNGNGHTLDDVLHLHDVTGGTTTNLGLVSQDYDPIPDGFVALVHEAVVMADLNGDGDTGDTVPHLVDVVESRVVNLGVAGHLGVAGSYETDGDHLMVLVREADQGATDLNGDGDTNDQVLHVLDPGVRAAGGEPRMLRNLGLASPWASSTGDYLYFLVREQPSTGDLDGDGDLNGEVMHLHHFPSRETRNLGLSTTFSGGYPVLTDRVLAFVASEAAQSADLNGDGDRVDNILQVHSLKERITTNTRIQPWAWGGEPEVQFRARGGLVVLLEEEQVDENGDGDTSDFIVHVVHVAGGLGPEADSRVNNTRRTGQGTLGIHTIGERIGNDLVVWPVSESAQGETDLDGDGDAVDRVVHAFHAPSRSVVNVGLHRAGLKLHAGRILVRAEEASHGDLNGDGDVEDVVLQVVRLQVP